MDSQQASIDTHTAAYHEAGHIATAVALQWRILDAHIGTWENPAHDPQCLGCVQLEPPDVATFTIRFVRVDRRGRMRFTTEAEQSADLQRQSDEADATITM